ncbi:MAG: AraC family transcriptional regulator [Cyclobacteriaceae bacterium]
MTFVNGLFLFFAGQGFFLAYILIQQKKNQSNPWISFYVASYSLILVYWVVFWEAEANNFPFPFHIPFQLSLGPLLYMSLAEKRQKRTWIHFLPLLLFLVIFPHLLSKYQIMKFPTTYFEILPTVYSIINKVTKVSFILYMLFSLRLAKSIHQRWLLAGFVLFVIGFFSYEMLYQSGLMSAWIDYSIALIITINFYTAGYYYFIHYKPYSTKGKNEGIEPNPIILTLTDLVKRDQKYLDADLRIEHLSRASGLSIADITQAIKSNGYSNFKEYINTFRIDHAKKLLETSDLKILAVALDSGFTNKVSFIQNFKKHTSTTPNDYRMSKK